MTITERFIDALRARAGTPQEFGAFITREMKVSASAAKESGAKVE